MGKKMKSSASETGMWFYHAPVKTEQREAVGAPPASQIPLLNPDLAPSEDDRPKMWIRDSDSDYIKMAKMGGRPDLLSIRENRPSSKGPKAYPRVDWFYLEDNQLEGEQQEKEKEKYEFMLPDYMVHPDSAGARGDHFKHQKTPYSTDQTTVFEREGRHATDKTVKLPEVRPAGYGYRQERHQGKPVAGMKHQVTRPERMKGRPSEMDKDRPKREPVPVLDEKEPVAMGKIMSYSYGKDWLSERDRWYDRQQKVEDKFDAANKSASERRLADQNEQERHLSSGKAIASGQQRELKPVHGQKVRANREEEVNKELFKMSRFKKIPAKTDSHRPKAMESQVQTTEVTN